MLAANLGAAFPVADLGVRQTLDRSQMAVAGLGQILQDFIIVPVNVDDDLLALQEWRRILVPGGWLILSVPAYQALWSQHDVANAHRRRYRAEHLRSLLRRSGFTPVRITYFNTLLLPGVALVRWAERVRGDVDGNIRIEQAELDLQKRLPKWIERCCEEMLSLEARWIRRRALPAGVSIGAIARAVRPTAE